MSTRLYRFFELERGKVNKESRTVPLAFSSEFPVKRTDEEEGDFWEVLDHTAVDLSRSKSGLPLLDSHNLYRQIGIVEDITISNDEKMGRGNARFSRSPDGESKFQDVLDGVSKYVSVGYELQRIISKSVGDAGLPLLKFAWMPFEVSMVAAPEDPNVGIGRGVDDQHLSNAERGQKLIMKFPKTFFRGTEATPPATPATPPASPVAAPAPTIDATEVRNKAKEEERKRQKAIRTACDNILTQFPQEAVRFRGMADKAIDEGKSSEDFNAEVFAALPGVKKVKPITARSLGMSEQDIQEYSLGRAIRSMVETGKLEGREAEVHQAMSDQKIGVRPEGFWVPPDIMIPAPARYRGRVEQRDLQVNTFGQGGALVPTILTTSVIELLRNRMVANRLGVQSMAGLSGNVAIPRQTGAATAYALPESATLTKSTQALDQIMLNPHRVGAWNDYTKQLLLQSSVDVENFIRDDLLKVLAIKWDKLILEGQGANSEPTGILNTIGISSVVFGATATWSKVVQFETNLALANADAGSMAYVTTPNVKGAWKTIAKIGSTFPIFLWDNFNWGDGSNDGEVNGYRAAATNQISNSAVAFGHWADAIGPAMWGGYDVVVNPYSRDTDAAVRVTVNTFGDVAVRHAASFCWSADSGNQ